MTHQNKNKEYLFDLRLFWVSFLVFAFTFQSCKSIKTPDGTVIKNRSTAYLLKRLNQNKMDVNWFSAKAKVSIETPDDRVSATANIRLRKDSVIWMNVRKLGVEAARVLIDQDSVYIIDRINNEYAIKSYDFIDRQFNLSALSGGQKLDFALLQNFLLGNPQFFSFEKVDAEIEDYKYLIAGSFRNLSSQYWIEPAQYFLTKMFFQDTEKDRSFSVDMADYKPLSNQKEFAYLRNLNVKSKETGDISVGLKFSNVEINTAKTIRFSIPSRYKKVD